MIFLYSAPLATAGCHAPHPLFWTAAALHPFSMLFSPCQALISQALGDRMTIDYQPMHKRSDEDSSGPSRPLSRAASFSSTESTGRMRQETSLLHAGHRFEDLSRTPVKHLQIPPGATVLVLSKGHTAALWTMPPVGPHGESRQLQSDLFLFKTIARTHGVWGDVAARYFEPAAVLLGTLPAHQAYAQRRETVGEVFPITGLGAEETRYRRNPARLVLQRARGSLPEHVLVSLDRGE